MQNISSLQQINLKQGLNVNYTEGTKTSMAIFKLIIFKKNYQQYLSNKLK